MLKLPRENSWSAKLWLQKHTTMLLSDTREIVCIVVTNSQFGTTMILHTSTMVPVPMHISGICCQPCGPGCAGCKAQPELKEDRKIQRKLKQN